MVVLIRPSGRGVGGRDGHVEELAICVVLSSEPPIENFVFCLSSQTRIDGVEEPSLVVFDPCRPSDHSISVLTTLAMSSRVCSGNAYRNLVCFQFVDARTAKMCQ